jgi:hypothetical protein
MSLDVSLANSNLLDRICDLVQQVSLGGGVGTSLNHLRRPGVSRAGEGLELWVKHFLAGTINRPDDNVITSIWDDIFSFHGGTNNPPDVMVRNSIAVEVKKTESRSKTLQLNSSWPIRTLSVSDQHITQECRESEQWEEKPFLLVVGRVNSSVKRIENISIVDGRCLSDHESVYLDLIVKAQKLMLELGGNETREIGRFNSVDARNRTSLRVRPMFYLVNPAITFQDFFISNDWDNFTINVLLPESSYEAFETSVRYQFENFNPSLCIDRRMIDDPTDSAKQIPVVHIHGSW